LATLAREILSVFSHRRHRRKERRIMVNLIHANRELYRRRPDECFPSLEALAVHCRRQKQESADQWLPPQQMRIVSHEDTLRLQAGPELSYGLTQWSFGQLCSLARVSKETVNRLLPETASRVFAETMPHGRRPLQLFTTDSTLRSVHGVSYTRLWNLEVMNLIRDYAADFTPPQQARGGGTGLYAGEQDMFCFLIDPLGWAEIDGQAFAPGFFVWNSEVGKRSVGISTFWFQAVCANHIVWDAVEVLEFTRKHTSNVAEVLLDIRRAIEGLVTKRNERRDGFVRVMEKALREKLGEDREDTAKALAQHGINRTLAEQAVDLAARSGRFTIFSLVDALTRLSGEVQNAGDRLELDAKAASLLALAV
jgi:hypothetical protein